MTKAKNSMKASELFQKRNEYKFVSSTYADAPRLLFDSLQSAGYGKLSENGETMLFNRAAGILSPANTLSTLSIINGERGVWSLDFVAKAYQEMIESLDVKFKRNPQSQASVYREISPVRGWEDYATYYRAYLDSIYDKFISEYFSDPQRANKITDVASFIKEFSTIQGMISRQTPYLLSSFVRSNNCPPHVSGLVIDLAHEDCGNDEIKVEKYLKDVNFSAFVRHCNQYGFMVDKNVPWRVYANLKSEHMETKMAEQGVPNTDHFFNVYFNRTETSDFLALIESYAYLYTKLVNDYPNYTKKKICDKKVVSVVHSRQEVETFGRSDVFFGDPERGYPFWIKLYIYTKINEKSLAFSQEQMDALIKSVTSMNLYLDIQKALVYTNEVLNEAEQIPASLMKTLRV